MKKSVKFKNRTWDVAANLHLPSNFDEKQKYSAIVCVHPGSSVKEQTAGLYAKKLAEQGFVTLAFDASFQGESGGEPRYFEDPATRVEDVRCAVDYLTTLNFVDENRIGVLGVCAGGGYSVNAALSEKRIKAVGVTAVINIGRAYREHSPLQALEAVGKQRTAEAHGAEPMITPWTPNSPEEAKLAGITDLDTVEAVEYYRTSRAEHPRSSNKLLLTSMASIIAFDAFHLAGQLLTQPLLIVVGDKVGSFGSYRDGFDLLSKAASKNKSIHVIPGASHYDLYDQPEATAQALVKLVPFFKENL
jgi:hypothetical protein